MLFRSKMSETNMNAAVSMYDSVTAIHELNSIVGFDPRNYMRMIGEGKDNTRYYLDVAFRKLWFRLKYPEGKITEDEVRVILAPILRKLHKEVDKMTRETIDQMNEKAGIGLKAVSAEYDLERENELVKEISRRSFEDGFAW